jgi:hypothetical protein
LITALITWTVYVDEVDGSPIIQHHYHLVTAAAITVRLKKKKNIFMQCFTILKGVQTQKKDSEISTVAWLLKKDRWATKHQYNYKQKEHLKQKVIA